jgi:hypothetical protein
MASVVVVVVAIALIVAWNALIYAQSGGRGWSPLWMAFNCTAAAGLFLLAGLSGYTLSRHERFLAGTAWTGHVIWWQVTVGAVAAVAAGFFWRQGLRQPPPRRASRA